MGYSRNEGVFGFFLKDLWVFYFLIDFVVVVVEILLKKSLIVVDC
jgi:hypothetical protein